MKSTKGENSIKLMKLLTEYEKKKNILIAPIKESININLEYKNTEFKNCLLFLFKKIY